MRVALVTILLTVIVAVRSADYPSNEKWSSEQVKKACADIKDNRGIHFPFRCVEPDEDFGRIGKSFLKRNPHLTADDLAPIVLIPGLGGSALEAKINKENSPAWYCFKTWDWFRIWLAMSELVVQTCMLDNLKLTYDNTTNTYQNTNGVDIRPIDFGGVHGIDYLDYIFGFPNPLTSAYATMVQSFEAVGYEVGKNLFGAPYDWRIPPDAEGSQYYIDMKNLIETAYANSNGRKVNVVTHSMGGPVFLYFLNTVVTSEWKEKYIASFIPIAGPWAGASKALKAIISGDNFGIEVMGFSIADKLKFRSAVRQAGGPIFLVPDPDYWEDQIFVYTKEKNYTAGDLKQLFIDIGTPETATVYDRVWEFIPNLRLPGVPTHCIYGTNTSTEFYYHYETDDFDSDPIIQYELAGDGTVPLRSLKECNTWKENQDDVSILEVDTGEHLSIIEDEEVVEYILKIVTSQGAKQKQGKVKIN